MDRNFDDTVGGRRAQRKFVLGCIIGIAIIGCALAYSSQRMDVGRVFPIVGPPDNAGAAKPSDIK